MKINLEGLNLIKKHEGCRLTAYKDIGGVLTIGYGHTGVDVTEFMTITQQQADNLLLEDISRFEDGVSKTIERFGLSLNENEFSALVSFSFNLGLGVFRKSSILTYLDDDDKTSAAEDFLKYKTVKGKVVPELVRRREEEKELFLKMSA